MLDVLQLVVEAYLPATAITEWPQQYLHSTDFALQYGGQDLLAPPCPCEELKEQLSAKGLPLQLVCFCNLQLAIERLGCTGWVHASSLCGKCMQLLHC